MPAPIKLANGQQLRPLTARSVILSTLLGADDGAASAHELVQVAREFGITDTALRAALSRMLSGGDVRRAGNSYVLTERLAARHQRQDEAVAHVACDWDGRWTVAVVTAVGRPPADRVQLRSALQQAKFSELREGVWMRPANLSCHLDEQPDVLLLSSVRPQIQDDTLVAYLWDLPAWSATAWQLAGAHAAAETPAARFTVAAAIVRHLLDDPALPSTLLPPDYPASTLRDLYASYRAELSELRVNAEPDATAL